MPTPVHTLIIFPNQLFEEILSQDTYTHIILVEDDLFFRQYRFHKQKLILHRASMREFQELLGAKGLDVTYIETSTTNSMQKLTVALNKAEKVAYYDVVDDWLEQRLSALFTELGLRPEVLATPAFLTNRGAIEDYFAHKPKRMQSFYEWQRKRLTILVENDKPVGGKWSYDTSNRKRLPKDIVLPPPYPYEQNRHVQEAMQWVVAVFPDNPGNAESFSYATTHDQARSVLELFLTQRLANFGPYEDAIASEQSQLFHSLLSPLLNTGLLTPRQVVTRTLQYADTHPIPIESLEGFIRQIIGWREYMRATYIHFGRDMRTQNTLKFERKLDNSWWNGTTGLAPVDRTIKRVIDTAYAHHIERLMVLGNAMLLLRIHPDEVYEWFMCFFIDAYDWVMVPNVYAMSQFAAGSLITTKPYVSGSNYILKMSDYTKDDWSTVWDALYWQFIDDHRKLFEANPRSSMMVRLLDRMPNEKRQTLVGVAFKWLSDEEA